MWTREAISEAGARFQVRNVAEGNAQEVCAYFLKRAKLPMFRAHVIERVCVQQNGYQQLCQGRYTQKRIAKACRDFNEMCAGQLVAAKWKEFCEAGKPRAAVQAMLRQTFQSIHGACKPLDQNFRTEMSQVSKATAMSCDAPSPQC
jgi:hypothetical protein